MLIEQINDPLLHLVRNAMDHGIETSEARIASGKSPQGTLRLAASQDAGSIVIEVTDDGSGINRARVLAKAREQGLVQPDETPSDAEILNLILRPGFSTSAAVTNLSGRGVGMDVVKRNVEQLRGSLEIESREGLGTTFRIRLPLTLAIIDGFLLRVGGVAYVVPLELVEECVDLEVGAAGGDYLALRGKALPLLPLYETFGHRGTRSRRRGVIVVRWGGRRVGLVVDELLGKLQTVIKPMSPLFQSLSGITGSTVLGDGTIALILDVPGLLSLGESLGLEPVLETGPSTP
jgi:two-component system chemotaxis sensor kinase CheA